MAELSDTDKHVRHQYAEALRCLQEQRPEWAILHLQVALELNPKAPELHFLLFESWLQQAQPEVAWEHLQQSQELLPKSAELFYWAGRIREALADNEQALQHYQQALRFSGQHTASYFHLARLYHQLGQKEQAIQAYQRLLQLQPQALDVAFELAEILKNDQQHDAAKQLFLNIYTQNPERTDALLGWLELHYLNNPALIVDLLIKLAQDYPYLRSNLAVHASSVLRMYGNMEESNKSLELALQDPALPDREAYQLQQALQTALVPQSVQEIQNYQKKLSAFLQDWLNKPPPAPLISSDYSNIFIYLNLWSPISFLPYFNLDPKGIREAFGKIFQLLLPPQAEVQPPPRQHKRLAFVMNSNTAVDAFLQGVCLHWPKTDAELNLVYTASALLKPNLEKYRPDLQHLELPADPQAALSFFQQERFDLIFFTELHTDRFLQNFLASHRLAPVQVTSWLSTGTSGLKHIDYFISSQLLEQADEPQKGYSETLILMREIPTFLTPPIRLAERPERSEYGLPEVGNLYICPHLLFKLHPDFDQTIADILRLDPEGLLVFQARPDNPFLHQELVKRFEKAFPELMTRIWFLPKMDKTDYWGLMQIADVMLDPFYFGGGTTSYEALGLGLPIITWPGERLPGRVTYAYYQKLGVLDCVAYNPQDYAQKAVQIATEPHLNAELRARIKAAHSQLFENHQAVAELAQCLIKLAEQPRAGDVSVDPVPPSRPVEPADSND